MKLEIDTDVPPVYDLEQVSPDSENDSKHDDLESPAFEPIGPVKTDDDMDISDGDDIPHQMNEVKSNISSISGLTSNESNNSSSDFCETSSKNMLGSNIPHVNIMDNELHANENCFAHEKIAKTVVFISNTKDLIIDQDAELSQVSSETSTSRLSIVTTNTTNSNEEYINAQIDTPDDCANVDEETQMQKFNESSSSNDSSTKYLYETSTDDFSKNQITQFNIKNEKIKFEGTERIKFDLNASTEIALSNEEKVKNTQKSQSVSRSSKKDDHFTHKGKATARQRSHSKDSNDGFTYPNKQNSHSDIQTININQSKSSNEQAYTQNSDETTEAEPEDVSEPLVSTNITSHPVLIDRLLVGNDLDLKSFIVENRADPIVSSIANEIEEDIISTNAKKPKVAENIFEAKRLMKIRKQIELRFQKKIGTILKENYRSVIWIFLIKLLIFVTHNNVMFFIRK